MDGGENKRWSVPCYPLQIVASDRREAATGKGVDAAAYNTTTAVLMVRD